MVRLNSWEDKDTVPILAGAGLTKTMAPRGDNSTQTLPLPREEFDNNELYMNLVESCLLYTSPSRRDCRGESARD